MIVDNASGFSNGFDAGYGNHWHTYLGPTATARILYGDLANKTLAAPVFSGTIPTITGNEGDADIVTDLSTYFSGATSYSIDPAVEAGWTFDTGTGILTVTTGTVNTFGPYTVTGTNATGSDVSNAFSVIISEVETGSGGGYNRPQYYSRIISYTPKVKKKKYEIEIPPIPVEETAESYAKEIDRFEEAKKQIETNLRSIKQEIQQLADNVELEQQIKREELIIEQRAMANFKINLAMQIIELANLKKRRREEEQIALMIASGFDEKYMIN